MLNPFPELLVYGFFAPTLLRIAAGLVFLYIAYKHYTRREMFAEIDFPLVGRGVWIVWFAIFVEAAVGAMLVFGYYTQIAALLGAIAAAKYFFSPSGWVKAMMSICSAIHPSSLPMTLAMRRAKHFLPNRALPP